MSENLSKRKLDTAEDRTKRRKVEEIGHDSLGIEDYLSRLPVLCLLEILKHLRKKTLFQMLTVSKIFYAISNDKSLDPLKRKDCSVIISKTNDGFGFELLIEYKNNPMCDNLQMHYEVIKNAKGEIFERNRIDGALPGTANGIHHRWPVPDVLFTALKGTLEKYEIKYLTIRQKIDEKLISILGRVLIRDRPKILILDIIKLTNVHQKTFSQFINRFKYVEIMETDFDASIFNRQFLIEIGQSRLRSFWWDVHPLAAMENYFDADELIIPCIAHLKSLNAFGMIVRADWLADLVMRHLDEAALKRRSKYIGKWRFSLDAQLTETHMRPVINAANYEYSLENDAHR